MIRVVVADDSVLLREGLVRLLEASGGFEVAGQAGDGEDLLRKVRAHRPDVAVIDVRMPPTHTDEGLRAARSIRADHPGTGVLGPLPVHRGGLRARPPVGDHGAHGLPAQGPRGRRGHVPGRRPARGPGRLGAGSRGRLDAPRAPPPEDPLQVLSPREHEVLGLMAEGRSNAAIAQAIFVTERAVEKHVTSIFSKLDLTPTAEDHRRVLAVLAYLRSS
jgi:DNA-binding NarL/FixJ family response regulator